MPFYPNVLSTSQYEVVAISSLVDSIPSGTAVKVDALPTGGTTPYSYFQVSKATCKDIVFGIVAKASITDTQFGRVILLNSGVIPVLMNETLSKGAQIKVTTADGKFGQVSPGDTPIAILVENSTIGQLAWAQTVIDSSPKTERLTLVNGNYLILETDEIVVQTMAGASLTLLTAIGRAGKWFTLTNGSAGNTLVDTTSLQTISGQLTITLLPYDSIDVYSTGTNYLIR